MVDTQRRTLQISLQARNLSQQAFLSVERSLKRIREAGRRAFDGIARVARSARGQLLGVVAAVGGAQKLIIEPAEFEDALARISIAGEGFANRVREIREVIEELATSTGTSREELAAGFENAAKRVETYEEAVLLVDAANKLAAVSGGNVADSVTGLSAVIENFGGNVTQVESIAARLFETTRRLPESAGEILTQIGNIAPQARLAGLSIDDLLAAVATAEQQGVRASSTFTALRTILDQITSPAGQAEEGFQKLGIETGASALAGQNVGQVFAQIVDRSRELGVSLGDLGLRGRSVNAFLAIAEGEGREFSDTLEKISSSSVPEFQRAFETVNSTTKSSIDAFRELTKVAATAFAGAYLDDLGAALGDANTRVDQVRIRASLAGLEFRQWVERIRPGIAAIRVFFEAIDNGLSVIRTSAELIVPFWVNVWNQARAYALEAILAISDFFDDFVANAIDRYGDLLRFIARATGTPENLIPEFAIETPRSLRRELEGITAEIDSVRGEFLGLEDNIQQAVDSGNQQFANVLRGAQGNLRSELEALEVTKREIEKSLEKVDPNAGLRASAADARSRADATFDELIRVLQERAAILERQGQDVIDGVVDIANSAIDAERNLERLTAEAAALRLELAALEREAASGRPVQKRVDQAALTISGATEGIRASLAAGGVDPSGFTDQQDDAFGKVKESGTEAAKEIEDSFAKTKTVLENSLSGAFSGFIRGAQSAKDVARDFFASVADGLARLASQELASAIFSSAPTSTGGGGGGGAAAAAAADGGVIPARAFADGGIVRGGAASGTVRAFADGGDVNPRGLFAGATRSLTTLTRVQRNLANGTAGRVLGIPGDVRGELGLFAEAGSPEAIVQLPDGESVPLRLDGSTPVVALPGGRTVPVRVTGDGLSDSDAMARLVESLEAGGGASVPLGPGGGVLKEPTLARIPETGPGLAAIPLPIGESIPVRVSPDGSAVVQLPKGRALPTMGGAVERAFRGPRVQARAFADGGIVRGAITPIPRSAPTGGGTTVHRVTADGGMRMGDSFHVQIQALDGPSVERILSSPEGRRAMEASFRNATQTRRDFRR